MIHTKFDLKTINIVLAQANKLNNAIESAVESCEDFRQKLPLLDSKKLSEWMQYFINTQPHAGCTFFTSSGTSGEVKLLVNALWRRSGEKTYGRELREKVNTLMIHDNDTVANLFSAGGFSTLYDGCNRLLEAIGCAILPIGNLENYTGIQTNILQWMKQLKVNVLLGTPTSVMQCLNLSVEKNIPLTIKKIVFTGEPFSLARKNKIREHWPEAKFFGLYGHSETGFVGFNTDTCPDNHYHVFDDWYFLEILNNNDLAVSTWSNPAIPILRYLVGDSVELIDKPCPCGQRATTIKLLGRSDKRFKIGGDLISAGVIEKALTDIIGKKLDFQIQISVDGEGNETITFVLDKDKSKVNVLSKSIQKRVSTIYEIEDCLRKGTLFLQVDSKEKFIASERQKRPLIIDLRRNLG